jgi:glycosyltransferase involved in cell wall biosynthesis
MPGVIEDPLAVMRDARLFVLSSRYEGFPNALLEAMSAGAASISFDCEHGPADLIRHGENGLLVPPEDVGALAAAMHALLGDEPTRTRLRMAAVEVSRHFSMDTIMTQWNNVVRSVTTKRFAK